MARCGENKHTCSYSGQILAVRMRRYGSLININPSGLSQLGTPKWSCNFHRERLHSINEDVVFFFFWLCPTYIQGVQDVLHKMLDFKYLILHVFWYGQICAYLLCYCTCNFEVLDFIIWKIIKQSTRRRRKVHPELQKIIIADWPPTQKHDMKI